MKQISDYDIKKWSDAGLLLVASDGVIEKYKTTRCPFTSQRCKSSCELFKNGRCTYRVSISQDVCEDFYREIDNTILFDDEGPKNLDLEDAQGAVHASHLSVPKTSKNRMGKEVEEIEKIIDEM